MPKLTKSIDHDCRCMKSYCHKQFDVMQEALVEEEDAAIKEADAGPEDADADESQKLYHGFSHYIKPSMVMNIYSLLDFWVKKVCEHQQIKRNLGLTYKDIRGDDDLHGYHKYLTKYAGIDLKTVKPSYDRLQDLRKVRNRFIHHGGYVPKQEEKEKKYSSIEGISVGFNLISIEDDFVWSTLEHTKKYLRTAAKA